MSAVETIKKLKEKKGKKRKRKRERRSKSGMIYNLIFYNLNDYLKA